MTPLCFLYFQGECRKLFCPAGTLPYHGECVFPFSHIVGAALEIHFRIELPVLTQQPRFVLHASSLHKVEQEISSRIQGHCTTCQSVLYRTSDRMLVLKVVTMTTEFCKMSHLLRILTQMTEEEIRYKVTLFGSVYDVKMKPLITSFPSETTELSSLTGNASCSAPVRFDTAFISEDCQQIKLTEDELNYFGSALELANNLEDSTDFNATANYFLENDELRYPVCIDRYNELVGKITKPEEVTEQLTSRSEGMIEPLPMCLLQFAVFVSVMSNTHLIALY